MLKKATKAAIITAFRRAKKNKGGGILEKDS